MEITLNSLGVPVNRLWNGHRLYTASVENNRWDELDILVEVIANKFSTNTANYLFTVEDLLTIVQWL